MMITDRNWYLKKLLNLSKKLALGCKNKIMIIIAFRNPFN